MLFQDYIQYSSWRGNALGIQRIWNVEVFFMKRSLYMSPDTYENMHLSAVIQALCRVVYHGHIHIYGMFF